MCINSTELFITSGGQLKIEKEQKNNFELF